MRVRIALEIKGLSYDNVGVDLPAGEHRKEGYRSISPDGLVPQVTNWQRFGLVYSSQDLPLTLAVYEAFMQCTVVQRALSPADPGLVA